MIWSVRQSGVDTHILGIVNERTHIDAVKEAERWYGHFIDPETNRPMVRTLVVEPGATQR